MEYWSGQTRASVPTGSPLFPTELITRLLVNYQLVYLSTINSSTLPNHNFELWTLNFELDKGVRFCGFPCSFRNSVSPSGFVPSVYSVLKMPQQRTYWRFSTTELIIILNYELCILNYTRASLMRVLFTFFKQKGAF